MDSHFVSDFEIFLRSGTGLTLLAQFKLHRHMRSIS